MQRRGSIKRYKLLKDLPTLSKGAIFEFLEDENIYVCAEEGSEFMTVYDIEIMRKKDWFEPLEDWEYMRNGGRA